MLFSTTVICFVLNATVIERSSRTFSLVGFVEGGRGFGIQDFVQLLF